MRNQLVLLACASLVGLGLPLVSIASPAVAGTQNAGAGSYTTTLPAGAYPPALPGPEAWKGVKDCGIQDNARKFVTSNAPSGAVPTNEWWSSLLFKRLDCQFSENLVAGPLTFHPFSGGLGVTYPTTPKVTATEYHYPAFEGTSSPTFNGVAPETKDFQLGIAGLNAGETKVDGWSDWTVTPKWSDGSRTLTTTIGHGSPFVYANATGGDAKLTFNQPPTLWLNSGERVGYTVNGHDYVAFAPAGATWNVAGSAITSTLAGKTYFSVAALPTTPSSSAAQRSNLVADFAPYAYSFITDTKVAWSFNESSSQLTTNYNVTTVAKEGTERSTVVTTIPHISDNLVGANPISSEYVSARGAMKTLVGVNSFSTAMKFTGALPEFPSVGLDANLTNELKGYVSMAANEPDPLMVGRGERGQQDTYWTGKGLGRAAKLSEIADQLGLQGDRDTLLKAIRARLNDWFTASAGKGVNDRVFYYDQNWGTMIGYPADFGSDLELNDHHFHWGYFIDAAATLAKHDLAWATQYGPMIELLIRDASNYDRGDNRFPFLRDFDVYSGHSWASGHGAFAAGQNQESSSESMNYAQALIKWGSLTGNDQVRNLGIYLYTTEAEAVRNYWHDQDNRVFPANFNHDVVGMVWGDGGAYATWWTPMPEKIHGINMLPFTAGSTYLGRNPAYVGSHISGLRDYVQSQKGRPLTGWRDILWQYQALGDPDAAWTDFRANMNYVSAVDDSNLWGLSYQEPSQEAGESTAHTFNTLLALKTLGTVDQSTTADTSAYAVFKKNGVKTYIASNPGSSPRTVRFSDGTNLTVAGGATATKGAVTWEGGTNTAIDSPTPVPAPTPVPEVVPPTPAPTVVPPAAPPAAPARGAPTVSHPSVKVKGRKIRLTMVVTITAGQRLPASAIRAAYKKSKRLLGLRLQKTTMTDLGEGTYRLQVAVIAPKKGPLVITITDPGTKAKTTLTSKTITPKNLKRTTWARFR